MGWLAPAVPRTRCCSAAVLQCCAVFCCWRGGAVVLTALPHSAAGAGAGAAVRQLPSAAGLSWAEPGCSTHDHLHHHHHHNYSTTDTAITTISVHSVLLLPNGHQE